MPQDPLKLKFQYPNLVFPDAAPFCLVCGASDFGSLRVKFRESPCPASPSKKLEFLAPLCEPHLTRAKYFRMGGWALLVPAAGLLLFAVAIPSFAILLGIMGAGVGAGGFWMRRTGVRGGIRGTAFLDTPGTITLTGASNRDVRRTTARPSERLRQLAASQAFPFKAAASYDREQAIAGLPSSSAPVELCGGRFIVLQDAILAFLDYAELTFETSQRLVWNPREKFAAAKEKPTWLPLELRDGTPRAKRGVALFIRREKEYLFAGRAELTAWPNGKEQPRRAKFTLYGPLKPPLDKWAIELPESLEHTLETLTPRLENSEIKPLLLRRVAKGEADSWTELLEKVSHEGEIVPELAMITPFLLMILEEATHPLHEEVLWLLASTRGHEEVDTRTAAAAGFETYLMYLDDERPELRVAAVFALQTADHPRVVDAIRPRIGEEHDERVQACMLLGLHLPGNAEDLPLYLQILKSSPSVPVRTVAALVAIESSPDAPPEEAMQFLRNHVKRWSDFEEWWGNLNVIGPLPLDPDLVLERHGLRGAAGP